MKKVVTRPDGTKEEIEGTSEELAEYERKIRGSQMPLPEAPEGGKRILNEEREELRRLIAEELEKRPVTHWHLSSCGCSCHHHWFAPRPRWSAGDTAVINPQPLPYTVTWGEQAPTSDWIAAGVSSVQQSTKLFTLES